MISQPNHHDFIINTLDEWCKKHSLELNITSLIENEDFKLLLLNGLRAQFNRKFKKVSYDDIDSYLSDDDESSYKFRSDANIAADSADDSSSDDETDNVSSFSASGKSQFHGMRVFDTIPSPLLNSYFSVQIDGKKKYIHKQTACWLLTDSNNRLSADRLRRVQQTSS